VHAEQDTLVIAPYAGPDDGMALSRRSPGFARVIPGAPRARILQRLPALRTAIRRNRGEATKKAIVAPLPPTRSADE